MNRIKAVPYDYYLLLEGTDQADLPRKDTYYIVARNGIFIHKGSNDPNDTRSGLVESVTLVLGPQEKKFSYLSKFDFERKEEVPFSLPGLIDCQTFANVKISQIPHQIAKTALAFFARVLQQFNGEAEVQLYYSLELDEFRLVCPQQAVSKGGVDYDRESSGLLDTPEGRFLRAGTIHSHCDFSAFHSGTDTADEAYEDGIHITFGHVDQPTKGQPFSVVASIVANNHRVPVDPAEVIEGIEHAYDKKETGFGFGWSTTPKETHKFYNMLPLLTKEGKPDSLRDGQVMEQVLEWIPNVRKQAYWGGKNVATTTTKPKGRRKGGFLSTELGIGGTDVD